MSYTRLLLWCTLALIGTLVFAAIAFFLSQYPETILKITVLSVLYFSAFCFLALALGKAVVKSKDLNALNKLFMVLVFLKLVTVLGIFLIFVNLHQPEDKWYVLPFIGSYIAYTVVEVISLKSLSK